MAKIVLEEDHIFEYIRDIINDSRIGTTSVNNAKYHHTTKYNDASSICRNGILSAKDLSSKGIKPYSAELLKIMDDLESHVNGNDGVSLAIMGLDDLYPNEEEYNSFTPYKVDFLVSDDIKAGRSSIHFGNEYIHKGSIDKSKLRSVDVRILGLIDFFEKGKCKKIDDIIERFNYLSEIAEAMIESSLDLPMREMTSQECTVLDIDKIKNIPKIYRKSFNQKD